MRTRRQVLTHIGGGVMLGALASPSVSRAADGARRSFRIIRDGADIGYHTVALSRTGDEIQAAIEIEIKVKVLGVTVYRYEMTNRETWRAGRLVALSSVVNDDGEAAFARVKADSGRLLVDGSGFQGEAPADAATTSYWSYDFLSRKTWISTQTGALQNVNCAPVGTGTIPSPAGALTTEAWAVTGDFEVTLHYAGRDWAAVAFDAGGETATYAPDAMSPSLQPVWDAAA